MKKTIRGVLTAVVMSVAVGVFTGSARAEESPSATHRVEIGEVAPDFELESLDGIRLSPASLRSRAPLVLIFFRGSW